MGKLYRVDVYNQGELIHQHIVEAVDALSAINLVEVQYGTPPKVEDATVQLENGRKEHVLIVADWHGYSFEARQIQ